MRQVLVIALVIVAAMMCGFAGIIGIAAAGEVDEVYVNQIRGKIANDAALSRFNIDVSCHDGAIMLTGMVPDKKALRKAQEIAASVVQFHEVISTLQIASDGQSVANAQ